MRRRQLALVAAVSVMGVQSALASGPPPEVVESALKVGQSGDLSLVPKSAHGDRGTVLVFYRGHW